MSASAAVSRRLLLTGAFGVATAGVLAKLPGPALVAGGAGGFAGGPTTTTTTLPPGPPPVLAGATAATLGPDHVFDLVVAGGRVLDPETRYDAVLDVGIDGGTVTAIGEGLRGRRTIVAEGRLVAPGFVDLLSYEPDPYGVAFKIADGVTSNFGMHGINAEASAFFSAYRNLPPLVNYGGAFDHAWARARLGLEPHRPASADQRLELQRMAERGLADGWVGVHLELEYTPGADAQEVRAMAEVARDAGVACYFHGRFSDNTPPGTNADTLAEIVGVAREVGVGVHVEHITSTGGTFTMPESLATLQSARTQGLDVTACMYPYDFWATYLGSARFDDGWQERFGLDYDDLVVPGTGERLSRGTFARHRESNTLVAAMGSIPEADLRAALASDLVMIGSDAILELDGNNHPRAAGTFARVLRYVRDEQAVDGMLALAKMSLFPAQRLTPACPAMARKGRLQIGADADLVVIDPERVEDKATVPEPAQPSVGMEWVLVAGRIVKDPEVVHTGPGAGVGLTRST